MNRAKRLMPDIYLSCATLDRDRAGEIVERLSAARLTTLRVSELEWQQAVAADQVERIWGALRASAALVVLGTRAHIRSPVLTMEVGAALADHKPIYVLVDPDAADDLPIYLQRQHVLPLAETDRWAAVLQESVRPAPGRRRRAPRPTRS
jgi:hypothetical protein